MRLTKLHSEFKKNGYLTFDYIMRNFFIKNPKNFIKENFDEFKLLYFKNFVMQESVLDNFCVLIEQELKNPGYSNLENLNLNLNQSEMDDVKSKILDYLAEKSIEVINESDFILSSKYIKNLVKFLRKELLANLPSGNEFRNEFLKDILQNNKKIEFGIDENLFDFIIEEIKKQVCLRKLHKSSEAEKFKRKSKFTGEGQNLNDFTIEELTRRNQYICNYCLLCLKHLKSFIKKFPKNSQLEL